MLVPSLLQVQAASSAIFSAGTAGVGRIMGGVRVSPSRLIVGRFSMIERTPSSIGIETRARKLLHIRQAETVGATVSSPAYAGVPILVSSMSPSCPMRGSRTEPQVSIDSATIGSVRAFRGSTSVNSSMPKLYSSVMPSGSRK